MENHSNKVMEVTWDVLHTISYEFLTTLREINKVVWNDVFDIISRVNKEFNK